MSTVLSRLSTAASFVQQCWGQFTEQLCTREGETNLDGSLLSFLRLPEMNARVCWRQGDNCWCQGEQHAWNSRDLGRILARYPSVRTARGCSLQRAVSGLGFRGGGCFAHGFAAVKAIKPAPIKKGGYWGQTLDFIPNAESYLQVLGLTSREVRLPVHRFALKSWDWCTFYVSKYSVTLTSGIWDCIYDTLNPTLCSS